MADEGGTDQYLKFGPVIIWYATDWAVGGPIVGQIIHIVYFNEKYTFLESNSELCSDQVCEFDYFPLS